MVFEALFGKKKTAAGQLMRLGHFGSLNAAGVVPAYNSTLVKNLIDHDENVESDFI